MATDAHPLPATGEPAYDLARLRGFSDGVFAIAITITVLQLVVPGVSLSADEVTERLLEQWPIYMSLVIGFVVVGYYWLNHHRVFELLDRADGWVIWANHLLLLFVVFMPYPTEMLGLYHEYSSTWVFFCLTGVAIGFANSLIWWYATTGHRLVPGLLDDGALRVYRWRSTILPVTFLVASGLALIGPFWALAGLSLFVVGRPVVHLLVGPVPDREQSEEALAEHEQDEENYRRGEFLAEQTSSSLGWLLGGRSVSSLARLIAFTDGVYAIAITLLGLQFAPPTRELVSDDQVRNYLLGHGYPEVNDLYVGYLVGFAVIGLFWILHNRYFTVIRGQDAGLRVLTLAHLFFIVLLPDATEFISVHADVASAVMYYATIAGCASLTMSFIWRWASWHHHLIAADISDAAIRLTSRLGLVVPVGFFVSIPLAPLIGQWAQVTWFASIVGLRVYVRGMRSKASA